MQDAIPFETFAPLSQLGFLRHAFSLRSQHDTRADDFPARFARQFGRTGFAVAEQPHGNGVAVVSYPGQAPGVDALVTTTPGLPLLIRCADCAPVFLVNRRQPAIALVHSGKKGTLANVVGETRRHIDADFAFVGPCIGPCHYDFDLWSALDAQLAGVEFHHPRTCTACHLDRYYSYRAEKGQTGRMFALLEILL